MAWNITIHEHVLTGTDREFYFAFQGIDMHAGKWNAAYYNMLKKHLLFKEWFSSGTPASSTTKTVATI